MRTAARVLACPAAHRSFARCLTALLVDALQHLASVFSTAGLHGWSFPNGLASPEVGFKLERFGVAGCDRTARVNREPGVGWVRLFPARTTTFDAVEAQVAAWVAQRAAGAAARATPKAAGAASAGAASAGGKRAVAAPVVLAGAPKKRVNFDVFGDPLDDDDDDDAAGGSGGHKRNGGKKGAAAWLPAKRIIGDEDGSIALTASGDICGGGTGLEFVKNVLLDGEEVRDHDHDRDAGAGRR